MKARIQGFDTPFREIETLTMKGINGTYFVDDIEFEQDRWQEPCKLNPEKDLSNPIDHWQDVRERAAIAAMQGLLVHNGEACAKEAVIYADALVAELKGE